MSKLGELAGGRGTGVSGGRSGNRVGGSKKPSLVEDAYRALKEAIRENVFPPGYQGSEQEIALKLNMSRTPVHEAIIRLQEEGLIRVLAKRGVVICAISPEDMREIYDVIIACESMAAELMAAMEPDDKRMALAAELAVINDMMAAALQRDDLTAWAKADEQFHQSLVERCGNARIARVAQTIMDQSHRARMLTLRLRPKPTQSVAEHAAIIEAIRSGDVDAARETARAHRNRARNEIIPLLAQLGMTYL